MEIKLYNDIAFKWIFGRQEHTVPLIGLINSVLCHDDGKSSPAKFSEIQILNPYDYSEPFKLTLSRSFKQNLVYFILNFP